MDTRQRLEQWKEAANQNAAQVAALSEQLEQTRSMLESIEARCRELEAEITDLKTKLNDRDRVEKRSSECIIVLLMVSSSLYVSHMFVTRVLSSLVFRVVLL